MEQRE